jgi:hypothetical protein
MHGINVGNLAAHYEYGLRPELVESCMSDCRSESLLRHIVDMKTSWGGLVGYDDCFTRSRSRVRFPSRVLFDVC